VPPATPTALVICCGGPRRSAGDRDHNLLHVADRVSTLPKSSRTRRHTRLKRHQVVPTHQSGAPGPNNRLIAYLARSSSEARRISQPGVRGDQSGDALRGRVGPSAQAGAA
jgi:hypothetical protein